MRITNVQKKELSDIFRASGLNLLDYETSGQHKEFKIKFKYEYFSFSINIIRENVYELKIFPVNNTQGYSLSTNWAETKKRFETWANEINIELTTATGWESFQSDNFLNAEYEDLEVDFLASEKIQTRASITELKEKVKTLELPESTLLIISKKLDELSLKVDSLKKFDWKALFVGSIASLIMTLGIPPEASGLLWEYIKTSFSGLKLNA